MNTKEISKVIDTIHLKSNDALQKKDLTGYMSVFADTLKYKQSNGQIIDKTQLTQDQKRVWSRIIKIVNNFKRLKCSSLDNTFSETVMQELVVWIRVFWVFKKKWKYQRTSCYEWATIDNNWKIINVEIIEEKINYG